MLCLHPPKPLISWTAVRIGHHVLRTDDDRRCSGLASAGAARRTGDGLHRIRVDGEIGLRHLNGQRGTQRADQPASLHAHADAVMMNQ